MRATARPLHRSAALRAPAALGARAVRTRALRQQQQLPRQPPAAPAHAASTSRCGHTARCTHGACRNTKLVPSASNLAVVRAATLCLVNRERAAHGERALRRNARLERAAQGHTESMAFGDYFEHIGPGGQTPLARMRAAGYISSSRVGYEIGENIAWGTLWLATPQRDRRRLDGLARAPREHPRRALPRNRRSASRRTRPPRSRTASAGGVYTQDFGVIVERLSAAVAAHGGIWCHAGVN